MSYGLKTWANGRLRLSALDFLTQRNLPPLTIFLFGAGLFGLASFTRKKLNM